ncbi:MAG: DUF1549 domain-containing protein [Planctomycetes bacterium]|nr:DUF1549 domain-containing protein [Planctomycetota bacterium]
MNSMHVTTWAILALSGFATAQQAEHALDRKQVTAAAERIDELVEIALEQSGMHPNEIVDDATFLRRAYLTIVGRIPDHRETTEFLESKERDKRDELVDTLLLSKGHASTMFNYWSDVLRARTRLAPQTSGAPYLKFLATACEANTPFDEFVREMLTASGPAHARDNGATGYYLRDKDMPADNMANSVRVFLGTRLECAQCHDHPFDRWTQREFFEMAAFTGGIEYRQDMRESGDADRVRSMAKMAREGLGEQGQRAFRRMLRNVASGVNGSGTGVIQLPDDYRYDDAKPGQFVTAKAMFGDGPQLDVEIPRQRRFLKRRRPRARRLQPPEIGSREAYAVWMTSPDNPRFTTVIANRMWKRVMGRGLIEPVDDMRDDTVATNPRLMTLLEDLMREVGYDLREFERVLVHTKTFRRAVPTSQPASDEVYLFPGPLLRRMTAEQIWDSMLTFVVHDVDSTIGQNDPAEIVFREYERFFETSEEEMQERIELGMLRETDPAEFRRRARELRAKERDQENDSFQAARRKALPLIRDIQKARRQGDFDREEELLGRLEQMGLLDVLRRANRNYLRASELPQPAPPGHFLQQFGQSDREQIEGSNDAATVPQVLTLLNGFLERDVLRKPQTPLMLAVARGKSPTDRIRAAFLATLNRPPTRDEIRDWKADIGTGKDMDGCRDLIWTLVNSHEFRFLR